MIFLSNEEFAEVFSYLKDEYAIFGPGIKQQQGIYTDTDICVYERLYFLEELSFDRRSYFSAKEIAFPVSEKLFEFSPAGPKEPKLDIHKIIIFARSCDIEGFLRLDKIYLNNGLTDFYYKRLREKISFFLIKCPQSFEGCFCQSVDTDVTEEYALSLKKTENGFWLSVKDKAFTRWFEFRNKRDIPNGDNLKPEQRKIKLPDLGKKELFKDSFWQEYSKRCIGCGRCNLVCPTCSCFSIYDAADDNGNNIRKRTWSACQIDGFAKVAGGHEYRVDKGQRMRYKMLHKFHDFKQRYGTHMCVGCGRCIEACPEYIDVRVSLDKLNHG